MTPLMFIAIRFLSYFSLLGILSAITLVAVIIIDGFSKHEKPGSLIDPMKTEIWPVAWASLPMSFGLIMAGFTGMKIVNFFKDFYKNQFFFLKKKNHYVIIGHAVFPTVYKDMQNPKQYPRMVNITYALTSFVYLLLAVCGYLMFGNNTMQEVIFNFA